ncbi:MAG: DUF87 domain-containing protein [Thermoanaerobaculia bacterium]|nr:DUF87 domain-containing protein [Thermoanaerobaculia bacterium]
MPSSTTPDPTAIELYEKLGAFYLGGPIDSPEGEPSGSPFLYDAKDLTTHAAIVGMTGSGKTGLGVTLLEEAAIDGIPALVIDPKGDLANLCLTFPDLEADDFEPWVDPSKAARRGCSVAELAAQEAASWKKGLAGWDQDGERIRRLRQAADVVVYTPGSEAGRPVSILSSFAAPGPEVLEDADLLADRISTTVSSLLGLLGLDADPVQSPEHILLSTLLDRAWRQAVDLDLADLIQQIQQPPIDKLGVLPLDSVFPQKQRFALAMRLNALLAAPTFQSWLVGEPLDIDRMLYGEGGKPRLAVFSIAHLSDEERMFFVSLLLSEALGWMRSRSGTSSLRALLYMDEVFGYLPPVGEPPSKKPLLTMLKQARAFGFGVVLSTQNPVDLDYKALSNIGTWFLGRLQTEQDQERVMDGLLDTDAGFDRRALESILSDLGKRRFLVHNVHESEPQLIHVRWAMSYLCGPLTREQIKRLTPTITQVAAADEGDAAPQKVPSAVLAAAEPKTSKPLLPGIAERFLPLRGRPGQDVVYRPGVVGCARVHFEDRKHDVSAREDVVFWADADEEVDWWQARLLDLVDGDLETEAVSDGGFEEPAAALADKKNYRGWEKDFSDFLYRSRRWPLLESEEFGLVSEPGESERDFRVRLQEKAREERDLEVEKARTDLEKDLDRLRDRMHRAQARLEKEGVQTKGKWGSFLGAVVEVGVSAAGVGRKRLTSNKISRVFQTFQQARGEGADDARAEQELEQLRQEMEQLQASFEEREAEIGRTYQDRAREIGTYELKPRRTDVDVRRVCVGWAPWREGLEGVEPAW